MNCISNTCSSNRPGSLPPASTVSRPVTTSDPSKPRAPEQTAVPAANRPSLTSDRFRAIGAAVREQCIRDRVAGRSVLDGARTFSNDAATVYARLSAGEGDASAYLQAGELAQRYLMGELRKEVADYAVSQLGMTIGDGAAAEGGLASSAGSALGAVGAGYSAYQLFSNWGQMTPAEGTVRGAAAGAYIGSQICPGFGTVVGGVIGGAVGLVGGIVKTGKHGDQTKRDVMRDALQRAGVVDRNWNLTLADGTLYDIGRDGGFRIPNVDGSERRAYEVDFGNPLAGEAVALARPLAEIVTGGDEKLTSDLTGYLVNAAMSNARGLEGVKENLGALGITSLRS